MATGVPGLPGHTCVGSDAVHVRFGALSKAQSSLEVDKEISKVMEVANLVGAKKVQDLEALLGMTEKGK